MTSTLIRKTLSLGAVALIASALAMPAFAADAMSNPCATKPANPCAQPAKHQVKKKAMKKTMKMHSAAKKHQKAANPCAAKPANPCAAK